MKVPAPLMWSLILKPRPSVKKDLVASKSVEPSTAWPSLRGSDWGRSQYTGRAATRAHGATGTVVRRGRDGLLRRSRGNLQIRDGAGGPLRGTDPAGPVLHVQSEAPQVAAGAGQVVHVVHADVQVDQPAGRRRHDAQLAAAGAGGEPAVFVGDEAEVRVVSGRFGHVRDTHRDGRQSVQSHAELPPRSAPLAIAKQRGIAGQESRARPVVPVYRSLCVKHWRDPADGHPAQARREATA